jgi:predicted RNase H-like HicB family nuclease
MRKGDPARDRRIIRRSEKTVWQSQPNGFHAILLHMSKVARIYRKLKHDPRDYEIRIQYSAVPGDECYIARVVECPTISAHGDTREEAARQIQLALEGALQVAEETGFAFPPPAALAHA